MSDFTGTGFDTFPSLYSDLTWIHDLADERLIPREVLERKVGEYVTFLNRDDLMPRAKKTANYILDHMIFELYEGDIGQEDFITKLEDDTCEEAV